MQPTTRIPERTGVTPDIFHAEILPAATPVVMRNLVAGWPVVAAGRQSSDAVCAYVRQFDRGNPVSTASGPPSIGGRLFYKDDLSRLNFRMGEARLSSSLDYLLDHEQDDHPTAYAVQSVPTREHLPGFAEQNPMPLLEPSIGPRIWLGNNVTIAAHQDPSENIACVAAGRRTFTLFPPDQVANLYIGPFELTPAGAQVSLVDFDNPDLDRFPRFEQAMEAAMAADLEPGDAIYIPYLWWHHVRSLDRVNLLVNYWWDQNRPGHGLPREALLHAMLAIKDLPASHRAAWKAIFNHYVFGTNGDPGGHIPEDRRGMLGELDANTLKDLREALANTLR